MKDKAPFAAHHLSGLKVAAGRSAPAKQVLDAEINIGAASGRNVSDTASTKAKASSIDFSEVGGKKVV